MTFLSTLYTDNEHYSTHESEERDRAALKRPRNAMVTKWQKADAENAAAW